MVWLQASTSVHKLTAFACPRTRRSQLRVLGVCSGNSASVVPTSRAKARSHRSAICASERARAPLTHTHALPSLIPLTADYKTGRKCAAPLKIDVYESMFMNLPSDDFSIYKICALILRRICEFLRLSSSRNVWHTPRHESVRTLIFSNSLQCRKLTRTRNYTR